VYQQNAGPEGARNTGLALATGEFVAFLDPDDFWLPDKMELQVRLLRERPDVVMVCSKTCSHERPAGGLPSLSLVRTRELTLAEVHLRNPVCTSTVVARKSVVDAVGRFRKGIRSEDWDLWMRLARAGKILVVETPLVVYRIHGENRSRNVAAELPWAVCVVNDNFAQLPATWANRRLHRQALAFVYLSGARLYAEHRQPREALRTVWRSWITWPFGFPPAVRRSVFERTRFGLGLIRRLVAGA
jgi:glycosyltransferase involved in cell wall biosynthesis